MDPSKIQLTTVQKIKPLLKAINDELPWQLVLISLFALSVAIILPTYMPVFMSAVWADILIRRILVGFIVGLISFFLCGFTLMFICEKLIPFFKKISEHYEKHALEEKKKILENVIEDEVLGVEK